MINLLIFIIIFLKDSDTNNYFWSVDSIKVSYIIIPLNFFIKD